MYIYILIFGVIMYFFIIERLVESKHNINYIEKNWNNTITFLFLGIMSMLLFISAFRAEHIGTDHMNYVNEFHNIEKYGDAYFTEKGFVLLNKIAIFLGGGTVTLTILVSSLFVLSFAFYIKKYVSPDYYIFSVLIFAFQPYFFIQSSFNIMRQGCASAIALFSIPFLLDKKWIKFIVTIMIASTFHSSILVMLLLIIIRKINISSNHFRYMAIIGFILNYFKIGNLIFRLFQKYGSYGNYESSVLNSKIYVLAIMIVIFYFASIYDKLYKNEKEKTFVNLFLVSLVYLLFAVQNDILYRVYISMALISVPGIAIICKNIRKSKPLIELCFSLYYCLFYIGYITLWYIHKDYRYVPFKFIFEQ